MLGQGKEQESMTTKPESAMYQYEVKCRNFILNFLVPTYLLNSIGIGYKINKIKNMI